MRSTRTRTGKAGAITILALFALLATCAAAVAATGGAPTPTSTPPPPGSGSGAPAAEPSAGAVTLLAAETAPRKSFYYGYRYPRLTFTIGSDLPQNDIRVDVVNATGEIVRTFYRDDVAPDLPNTIRWDGTSNEGKPARNGKYTFRVSPQTPAAPAARKATATTTLKLGFTLYGYTFPILGAHDFGGAMGRFGAGRSGHTHQGQDVMAPCRTPLVAARGGKVQYAGWDDGGGNYIVIDGKGTANDFVYMHMVEPALLRAGETVRTGQPIGYVGTTGSSSGCHLHFEIWSGPGWYEGGSPFDPLAELQKWDRYS
ncbi:MAG TPA: peptidoglycan DD-metalloendopeptidase family protein [Solirubrobacterales bacterium]|nr:peptidoglycan DD-metalloendopeptidase family protein [Solirubrobacterales bacterium]